MSKLLRRALLCAAVLSLLAAVPAAASTRTHVSPGASVCCSPPPIVHIPGAGEIMPLGDGVTVGDESSTGDGYRASLDTLLTAAGYAHLMVGSQQSGMRNLHHEGHGGTTIAGVASQIAGWLPTPPPASYPPEWVLLDAGTFDASQNHTGPQMLSAMSQLLDRILTADPYLKILVAQITVGTANTPTQQQAEADFNTGLPTLVASKGPRVRVIDQTGIALSFDGVDPSDAGYATMATRWYTAIQHWRGVS